MSRIYEALQRAEMERQNMASQHQEPALDDTHDQVICAPIVVRTQIHLENIARQPWTPSLAQLPALADRGRGVEQFRSLRSSLHMQRLQGDFRTVLVTSGLPEEGKTFVAVNLVMSLANNSDRNVLLVDADLRRPTTHKLLGSSPSPGLADYLEGKASLSEIIQRGADPKCSDIHQRSYSNVAFIAAGEHSDNALELVCSHRIDELISQLSPLFEWIIIDSPPVLVVTDAVDLARAADAILLVARAGRTPYTVAQKTQQAFSNSRLLGFVLNAVTDPPKNDSYYSYYSYYSDRHPASQPDSKWKRTKRSRK